MSNSIINGTDASNNNIQSNITDLIRLFNIPVPSVPPGPRPPVSLSAFIIT